MAKNKFKILNVKFLSQTRWIWFELKEFLQRGQTMDHFEPYCQQLMALKQTILLKR